MTAPFPQMPNVELGNTALDIASAVGSFAKGLQAERTERRKEAMSQALQRIQMMKLQQPNYDHIVVQTPDGPRHSWVDPRTGQTEISDLRAADPQIAYPTQDASSAWTVAIGPRNDPTRRAQPAPLPPGQDARGPAPISIQQETPLGPRNVMTQRTPRPGGLPYQTPQQRTQPGQAPAQLGVAVPGTEGDEQKARGALDMIQGRYEMRTALRDAGNDAPLVFDEASRYISTLLASKEIPILGPFIEQTIAQGQSVLSPSAASYFRAWMHATAARVFSQGGKTLTATEANWASGSLAPKPNEDPNVTATTDRIWNGIIKGSIVGNNAWQHYAEMAKQFGFDSNALLIAPPSVSPRGKRYGYTRTP